MGIYVEQDGSNTKNYFGVFGDDNAGVNRGQLFFDQYPPGGGYINMNTSLNLNEWIYVSYVQSGSQRYLYVNGKLVKSDNAVEVYTGGTPSSVYIGSRPSSAYDFNGYIDEPKIYNYARTADQIRQDYNKGLSVSLGNTNPYSSLSNGLVGWWKMDEASWNGTPGELKDSSGNNYNGVGVGGINSTSTAKFNRAGYFDGSNDYLNVTNSIDYGMNNFSVSFWMKADSTNYKRFFAHYNPGYVIAKTSDSIQVYVADDSGNNTSSYLTVMSGIDYVTNWTHITLIFDRQQRKILGYANGEYKGSASMSMIVGTINPPNNINIGTYTDLYDGYLDEVRMYNRSLSSDEVRHLYEWAPGPVAYYDFNENSGSNVYDKSGTGNNAIFSGTPNWDEGKIGSGVYTGNTTADFIDAPIVDINQSWTAMAWFKYPFTSTGASWHTLFRGNGGDHQILVQRSDMQLGMYDNGGTSFHGTGYIMTNLSLGWHHIATVGHDSVQDFYIDGVYVGQASDKSDTDIRYIGNQSSGQNWGYFDEVKIYNYARNQRQILEDMNAGRQNNPIAYWSFDEGQGTTTNDYIGSNDGVMTNMHTNTITAWQGFGKSGNALLFDGVNDYIDFGDDSLYTSDISVSAWFKTSSNGADMVLFANDATSILDSVGMDLGHIAYSKSGNTFMRETVSTFNDGLWHNLVLDTANNLIYIDGNLQALQTGSMFRLSNRLSIGSRYLSSWDQYWNGYIDEVKIYNYPITLDEIKENYNVGLQNRLSSSQVDDKSDGLVGWWKLDESSWNGTAGEVKDSSGIGNHGVATNANTTSTAKYEKAGLFTGTSSVNLGTAANLEMGADGAVTVSMWVRPTSLSNYGQLFFGGGSGGAQGYGMKLDSSGNFNYEIMGNSGVRYNYTSAFGLQVNNWYHITAIFDGKNNRMQAYLNGVLKHSVNISEPGAVNNADNFYLGMHSGPTWYYNGFMDDVKVYNSIRTPEQIVREYVEGPPPIRYWKFDEMSGTTVVDSAGSNYTGTLNNGPTWTVEGKKGGSLEFDGNDDLVELSSTAAPTLQQMSLSFYVKTNHTGNDQGIISKYQNWSYWNYQIYSDTTGKIKYNIGYHDGGTYVWENTLTSNRSINDNQWHHVVATYDRNQMKIYIDGVLDNSVSEDRMFLGGSSPLYIGAGTYNDDITLHYDESDVTFDGLIDEVKIYNYALTSRQVALENSNGAPIAYWNFDEGEGTTVYDRSGKENNAILIVGSGGTQSATSSAWTNGASGKQNGSLNFDGNDDYVVAGANPITSTSTFTLSTWLKAGSHSDYGIAAFMGASASGQSAYLGYVTTANVGTNNSLGGGFYGRNYGSGISDTNWHLVTLTFSGGANGNAKLYIDGELKVADTYTPNLASTAVYFGRANSGTAYFYNGQVDETKIWNYELTPEEIKKEYNGGFSSFFR
jgi:hypothetical protein